MKRIATIFAVIFILGCQPPIQEAEVNTSEDGTFSAVLPNGTVVQNEAEYETRMSEQIEPLNEMSSYAISLNASGIVSSAINGINIGKFRITILPDASYVEGCVRKKFLHLKVVVENVKMPIALAEIHILAWFDKGKPCFAIMNTGFIGYGWCYQKCIDLPKTNIKAGIEAVLVSAGVSIGIAKIMSIIITPVAVTALAI